ncbi:MAG TPA: helix-turn-helix transcriptional regulator [Candidatus Enterocloster excrementigallinarum]|uniref:Helix-turn-helix transcriptional regulator n=1 Tax=Candidatus Enterocloster excrementigallinarum TaxID=2838558 RepID=A0A9D2TET5_9FIRM|nr:helix-turn-helix transcriptional regulator [Candidatus Enterocloster excrementigallinarum]
MKDIDYGFVRLKLMDIMQEQNISINKLACRAEMQRTQLKAYMKNEVQRVDLAILARLCYVLDCDITDLLEYQKE